MNFGRPPWLSKKEPNWKHVNDTEIKGFNSLLLLSGVCRGKQESVVEMWSTDNPFVRPIFPATMSRTRFQSLLSFIKFDDHDTRQERQAADKLAAVRNL